MTTRRPPTLRAALERVRADVSEPITVVATAERIAREVVISARVDHDPTGLVQRVEVSHALGDGPWQRTRADRATVQAVGGEPVRYFVTAIGPGGAAVATHASAEVPAIVPAASASASVVSTSTSPAAPSSRASSSASSNGPALARAEEGSGVGWGWWLLGGVLVAAIGGLVVGLLVAAEPDTRVNPPSFETP
jgi:hypothetical protein